MSYFKKLLSRYLFGLCLGSYIGSMIGMIATSRPKDAIIYVVIGLIFGGWYAFKGASR